MIGQNEEDEVAELYRHDRVIDSIDEGGISGSDIYKFSFQKAVSRKNDSKFNNRVTAPNEEKSDDYFECQTETLVTSDNTLSKLKLGELNPEKVYKLLKQSRDPNAKAKKDLYAKYTIYFHHWMCELNAGFNLLLHGLGSKRRLIGEFVKTMLKDYNYFTVNGFFPGITIKGILNAISEELCDAPPIFSKLPSHVEYIVSELDKRELDIFLIVHNIDGAMLRNEKAQSALAALAKSKNVFLIASVDHVNAALMWNQDMAISFRWLWYCVPTYESYAAETSYENSLIVQQTARLELSSLTHVYNSLTPNAQGMFLVLVRHCLEGTDGRAASSNSSRSECSGSMDFADLYRVCRQKFLVNSELTLRAQLIEFRDHRLVKIKKSTDGAESLTIPLARKTLVDFVAQRESDKW